MYQMNFNYGKKAKQAIMSFCIVREWFDNGEFDDTDHIVVVKNSLDPAAVNLFLRRKRKQVYYCENFQKAYRYHQGVKWIVPYKYLTSAISERYYDVLCLSADITEICGGIGGKL